MQGKNEGATQVSEPLAMVATRIVSVVIRATDGRKTLLKYGFEFDFENGNGIRLSDWGADVVDTPTITTIAAVFEFRENMTVAQMFHKFPGLRRHCLTKNQIGEFLWYRRDLVRYDAPIFFILRNNGDFFIVKAILVHEARVKFSILRFEDERMWLGRLRPRLIIPV